MSCSGCEMLAINGVACHETGCPDDWRIEFLECFECGCEFMPEVRRQGYCEDCIDALSNGYSNDVKMEVSNEA